MNKTPKNTALLFAALIGTAPFLGTAASTNANPPAPESKSAASPLDMFSNEIVAQGKGVKITRAMLDEALVTIRSSAAARGQTIPPQQMKLLEAQVLGRLIGMQILNNMATPADKTAGAEAAQKQLDLMRKNIGSEENFARQLKTSGLTLDGLTAKLKEEATAETVLQREIKFEVSDEDAKKYYDENPGQFEQPEMVRAAHVLIGTRAKDGSELDDAKKKEKRQLAEDILKRAKAGEDFAKLAKEYSDDPGSKDKGGEYTFPRGQMVPEFESAAFSLQPNQVSDIVTTQYGYHIIKLYEKKPAKKMPLAEVAPDIKKFLQARGMQKQIPAFMEKIEKDSAIDILDPELKKTIDDAKAAFAEEKATETPKAKPVDKKASDKK
jgi:peptidyl-prolyl cis-trans isomerase C